MQNINCPQLKKQLQEIDKIQADIELMIVDVDKQGLSDLDKMINMLSSLMIKLEELLPVGLMLQKRERQKIGRFFKREVELPEFPKSVTHEKIRNWERLGFKLHCLPKTSFEDFDNNLKNSLYQFGASLGFFSKFELNGCWILVDTCPKPEISEPVTEYNNDSLAPVIVKLKAMGLLEAEPKVKASKQQASDKKMQISQSSRYGQTPIELESKIGVKQAFADLLNVEWTQVGLPRLPEYYFLGNIHHPEWSKTSTMEWLNNDFASLGSTICSGSSTKNGFSGIGHFNSEYRSQNIGFRLVVRIDK
ncbi:MAG: hypothetical protein WCG01_02225 [bacterium]